jgi:uncharacterized protein YjbI with pentapeptide repeats
LNDRRLLAQLLVAKTTDECVSVAAKHNILRDGLVDLAGRRVQFNHRDLDLRRFRLEGADLSGSNLINPEAAGVSLRDCVLTNIKITVEPGKKGSLRSAVFDGARIQDADIGPRTLDLSGASFREAQLVRVTFRMGALPGTCFERAWLSDVMLRSANLEGAIFSNATLERTNLEKAALQGANFTGAHFREMERWGEPDYTGAIIADEVRYSFGVVRDPVERLRAVIGSSQWSVTEKQAIERLISRVRGFATDAPEAMLIEDEYRDVIEPQLFRRVLKVAKQTN